jgi:DNA-binding MarR family transcriptional regulator
MSTDPEPSGEGEPPAGETGEPRAGEPRAGETGEPRAGETGEPRAGGAREPPGFELPLRLFLGFRVLIDEVHAELARQGHPDLRPMHGFVFQAIGPGGATAADLGRRLGISKQAAGKTIDTLQRMGYLERSTDPADARRKVVRLTGQAIDALQRSERTFDQLRTRWAAVIGAERLRELESDLRKVTPAELWRLDVPGWFGTA